MAIKNTSVILILMLIVGGIGECLGVGYINVAEGGTLVLKCLRNNSNETVEWRNPQGHVMFFNNLKGLRDSRSSIFTFNKSEYTIHVSNVTLKDEGVYKCLQYDHKFSSKRYRVKVLGTPKMEMAVHGDKTIIKCSAAANGHPPELSWLLSGIEIEAQPNTLWEAGSNRLSVVSVLSIKTNIRKATVMCLARHQALLKPLVDFIIIENDSITVPTTSYSSTGDTLKTLKTETMITVTSAPFIRSTAHIQHTEVTSVTDRTEVTSAKEITTLNSTESQTEQFTNSSDSNSTEGFHTNNTSTEGFDEVNKRKPEQYNTGNHSSPLLVLLVTCLIFCLLIVVIFFSIKLRRAHLAWKKENEESDQSVESSKSKSSHEEKQAQDRRRNGFWNSNFTEYKVEEETPPNETNSSNTEDVIRPTEDTSTTASSKLEGACVKETEL